MSQPTITKELQDIITEHKPVEYPDLLGALVGYTMTDPVRLVYDFESCVRIRMDEGATYEEALDDLGFNTLGQYVGEQTPLFIQVTETDKCS